MRFAAGGVGKSALTVRFVKGEFPEHYNPTIEGRLTWYIRWALACLPCATTEQYRREIEVSGETMAVRYCVFSHWSILNSVV